MFTYFYLFQIQPPIYERAAIVKSRIADIESMKNKLDKKEEDIKDLKMQLKLKVILNGISFSLQFNFWTSFFIYQWQKKKEIQNIVMSSDYLRLTFCLSTFSSISSLDFFFFFKCAEILCTS